ncbi:MAG: hypothetical protein AAFY17_14895 [Cyanobacteria bacterium J06642_11]
MRWLSTPMVKRILRWLLFGGILFFLAKTLKDHWQEVQTLQLTGSTWALLTVALGITLIAHIWSGWVWHWILRTIGQPRDGRWSTAVYLKTNIAKYLPGNVWHFYGRVRALQNNRILHRGRDCWRGAGTFINGGGGPGSSGPEL